MHWSSIKFVYLSLCERLFTPAATHGGRDSSNCCGSFRTHAYLQILECGHKITQDFFTTESVVRTQAQVGSVGAAMIPGVIVLHILDTSLPSVPPAFKCRQDPLLLAFSFCSIPGCDQQVRVNWWSTIYHNERLQSQAFNSARPQNHTHNNLRGTTMKKMWLKHDDTVHICLHNRPQKREQFLLLTVL